MNKEVKTIQIVTKIEIDGNVYLQHKIKEIGFKEDDLKVLVSEAIHGQGFNKNGEAIPEYKGLHFHVIHKEGTVTLLGLYTEDDVI